MNFKMLWKEIHQIVSSGHPDMGRKGFGFFLIEAYVVCFVIKQVNRD